MMENLHILQQTKLKSPAASKNLKDQNLQTSNADVQSVMAMIE